MVAVVNPILLQSERNWTRKTHQGLHLKVYDCSMHLTNVIIKPNVHDMYSTYTQSYRLNLSLSVGLTFILFIFYLTICSSIVWFIATYYSAAESTQQFSQSNPAMGAHDQLHLGHHNLSI